MTDNNLCFYCLDPQKTVTTSMDDRPACAECYDVCTDPYYADAE